MNLDEKIKLAISIYVDGQADQDEQRTAEAAIRDNAEAKKYFEDLQKLSGALKQHWPAEEISMELKRRIENTKKREGSKMSISVPIRKINLKVVASIAAAVTAAVVFTHLPEELKTVVPSAPKQPIPTAPVQVVREKAPVSNAKTMISLPIKQQESDFKGKDFSRSSARVSYLAKKHEAVSSGALLSESSVMYDSMNFVGGARLQSLSQSVPADFNTENYNAIEELSFRNVTESPLSTFSIDVDTASYANVRRFLNDGTMPPQDAVRIEEMINYFSYDYPKTEGQAPFSVTTEITQCPWAEGHELVLVGLNGKALDKTNLPPSNLIFLIDVSGSMESPDKLPLLQKSLTKMVQQLGEKEKVAIVTYAGNAGLVLPLTSGNEKSKILRAINHLQGGGATAGAEGIELAYQIAKENFIQGGNNRVILATDGDFNVGTSSDAELIRLIEEKRSQGVFLTVLGFGTGNLKDSKMEQLANKGNGNYFYIDSLHEAQKVLVQELGSTLFTLAKDVKIQIEFNPAYVKSYRLVGYENRALANEDFNNDKKDAGEMGAGHTVTALYEIVPASAGENVSSVDALKYQTTQLKKSGELMTVKVRYKEPTSEESKLITKTVSSTSSRIVTENMKLASAVAEFGLLLRKSSFKANANYDHVLASLREIKKEDKDGVRAELIQLVEKTKGLDDSSINGIQFKE